MSKKYFILTAIVCLSFVTGGTGYANDDGFVHANVPTDFNRILDEPVIDESAHVHKNATVIGHVYIGKRVFLAPHSFVRGDEGQPLYIGDESNVQDGAGIHALETEELHNGHWVELAKRRFSQDGKWLSPEESKNGYAVYIGKRVSIAHQALVHGPAWVGNDTFIGMQSQIFNAKVGSNVAIGVKSLITGGVTIPDGKYVPPGSVITTQKQANALPKRIGSPYQNTNKAVVHVNSSLADGYNGKDYRSGGDSSDPHAKVEHAVEKEHHAKSDSHAEKGHQ